MTSISRSTAADSSTVTSLRERSNTGSSIRSFASHDGCCVEKGNINEQQVRLTPYKSQKQTRSNKIIDWIQSIRLPSSSSSQGEGIAVITGLDRVWFGTQPAAEVVSILNIQPPRYLWYMLSGATCDAIQLLLDFIIHQQVEDASLCWALGFLWSILFRHSFHRYLVFGDYVGGYCQSLIRMYLGYSIIIVLSTLFNLLVTRVFRLRHYTAWILTLLWTGIANYFILKKIWSFGGSATSNADK